MTPNKRDFLKGGTLLGAVAMTGSLPAQADDGGLSGIAEGPFKPTWESLAAGYKLPDWFRDAKFGIWAHWSAQCVPEHGDWYGRNMYIEGHKDYAHHLATYGHPADVGFMEMNARWTAQNWDPDDLLDLYQKAGAKYFVALANHHDNFDNYDSKFHDWNSVKIGPKQDLIGIWAKAARDRGLKFGVSNHAAHAWHWFQTAYGYDTQGARKGERYDAFKLTKADGKGKWWEGLDPQALYVGPSYVLPDGVTTIEDANAWHATHDKLWDENPPPAHPEFTRQWYLRCKDLIDSYKPDMVYFDNTGLPLGQAGLDITAHYYNAALKWHSGRQDVVVTGKDIPQEVPIPKALEHALQPAAVNDIERGFMEEIAPLPWQTCTCLGSWHYSREIYETKAYKSAALVVHTLCNVVSKNGNLLLSVPVRGDGTIDDEERRIVEGIGEWMGRFSEAIYGTRPWRVAGEGAREAAASAHIRENNQRPFTATDIRFTHKKGILYAMTLGKPETEIVTIKTLAMGAAHAAGDIRRVEVLGAKKPLKFTRDISGLHIILPDDLSHAVGVAFKIMGKGLDVEGLA